MPHDQLAQLHQHFLGLRFTKLLSGSPLTLQRQQVLGARLGNHPFTPGHCGNLESYLARFPAVPAPTIERVQTANGVIWRVTYQGMVREHAQDWQAWVYYEWARALYCASGRQ